MQAVPGNNRGIVEVAGVWSVIAAVSIKGGGGGAPAM